MTYNKHKEDQQWYYVILRAQLHMTIEQVAEATGTSAKTVYRFERGDYKRETKPIRQLRLWYLQQHNRLLGGNTDEQ